MPLYVWYCKKCALEVELLRSFDEHRRAPEDAELGDAAKCEPLKRVGHEWEKRILKPNVAFGEGWSDDGRGLKGRH